MPDARWGEVVAVAVVRAGGMQAGEEELAAHLKTQLARFKIPRRWFFVEQLPKTALGKVQRAVLVKQLSSPAAGSS
jgi:fatty-acyl-CoA synthase